MATIHLQLQSSGYEKEANQIIPRDGDGGEGGGLALLPVIPWHKPSQGHPDSEHRVIHEPLWIHNRDTSTSAIAARRSRDPCHVKRRQVDGFLASLKACTRNKDLVRGGRIHDDLVQNGLLERCSQALLIMYVKCGELGKAKELLDRHKGSSNVVTWTALIDGYARDGHGGRAFECYEQMLREGILPDAVTYGCILKACAAIGAVDKGREIHDEITRQGLLRNNIVLSNALVDMYAKCGDVSKARQVLDGLSSRDVISWNALMAGYVQGGHAEQALNCFEEMQHEGILPDSVTYLCTLKACAMIRAADMGKLIHDKIERQKLLQDNIMLGNALIDMYAKCGASSEARRVLDRLSSRNVVSWSALVSGYAQEGDVEQALNCIEEMRHEGITPNAVTYASILKACGNIGAADRGQQIHEEVLRQGLLQRNIMLGGAVVDMYAKSGAVSKARQVLDGLPFRDVVSWSALIAGYAQDGYAEQALNCLEEMHREGILPNAVTCACVLNVCCHRGLVEEGEAIFLQMSTKYGVNPTLDCYICMIDLFGRAGHLEKAVRLIQDMPSSDFSIIWLTLLSACWKWSDVNVGRWAFERATNWDKSYGPAYVLMANIYAMVGMLEMSENFEALRIMNRAWKRSGPTMWV